MVEAAINGPHTVLQLYTKACSPSDRVNLVGLYFAQDPDYGGSQNATPWPEYTSQMELVRQGLRWWPAQDGLIVGDRTYAVFLWTATDPARERVRRQATPCG